MLEIEIDGKKLTVADGSTIMDAAHVAGCYIPHFCYHKKLSIAANCRMCLVQVEKAPKPLPACATPVTDGMKVYTHSNTAVQAQRGVMEFLLINHPLDCPVCDQGGECRLQDLAVGYGGVASRYREHKRSVANKDLGPLISTDMTRCIHCSRCVRFTEEIAGLQELGIVHRGEHAEVMNFVGRAVNSEISGNVIDLCPVGALTSKPFRYSARAWELSRRKSISPHDGLGSHLIVHVLRDRVMRVLPDENEAINECWLADRDRFSYQGLNSEQRLSTPMLKQGGQWLEVDWHTALTYVAHGLSSIIREHGVDAVAGLATAHATVEELYLFQKLLRGIGVENIDFRSRYADFRLDDHNNNTTPPHIQWLGQSISELLAKQVVLVIGSKLRKEQPLLAQRLRQCVKRGMRFMVVNLADDDLLMPLKAKYILRPDQLVEGLAEIVKALALLRQQEVPKTIAKLEVSEAAQAIAEQLASTTNSAVLLGNLATHHPRAAEIAVLAEQLAKLSGASLGWMAEAANTVGAQCVGVLPGSRGHHAAHLLSNPRKAYLLLHTELGHDTHHPAQALATVRSAEMVVAMSAYRHEAMDYADVMLPIAPFSETAGSFINMAGTLQRFCGAVKPLGQTRPAWKVLRVLGNLLALPEFTYDNIEQVRDAALPEGQASVGACLKPRALPSLNVQIQATSNALIRLGEVPMYQADAICRRAKALQQTTEACFVVAGLNQATLVALNLSSGKDVKITQAESEIVIRLIEDNTLPDGVLRLPAGHAQTALLGGMFAPIQLQPC